VHRLLGTLALTAGLALGSVTPAGATSRAHLVPNGSGGVLVSRATLTAARAGANSAVSLRFLNRTHHRILIRSVSSPLAAAGMIHFDVNMCQDGSVMIMVPDIVVSAHHRVKLSTRGMGAMLRGVRTGLVRGAHVLLAVNWTDADGHRFVTWVKAKVVRRPRHLHFGNAGTVAMEHMGSMG
jgi:copper(I)-binding protein